MHPNVFEDTSIKCHDYVIIIGYVSETLLGPIVSYENEGFKFIFQ